MTYMYQDDRENNSDSGFNQLLGELEEGDCMVVQRFSNAAKSSQGFLALMSELETRGIRFRSLEEGFDTDTEYGKFAIRIMQKVAQLDGDYRRERQREGINNAKDEGKYKGRKPIEVDEDIFDTILEQWKNGEITARQAMNELGLKPNTFYRRVKERMTETKSGEAIFNAAKQIGKEVVAGAGEFTQAAEKLASEYDANAMIETIGKNITAAGKVLNKHLETLGKDFQDAMTKEEEPKKPEFTEDSEDDKEWI